MTRNPHSQSRRNSHEATRLAYAERGVVVSTDNGNSHAVTVRVESTGEDEPAQVMTQLRGDTAQPTVGDRVFCLRRTSGQLVVVGSLYAEGDDVPNYNPQSRRVGHGPTDSNVTIAQDGTVTVQADDGTTIDVDPSNGEVVVDGGTTGVIRDISTTKDVDGHVTSITLDRSNTLFIP